MNKIGKAMLCTVLTGAMAVGAAGAADLGTLSPQGAKAYLNQITTLQNKYGKAAARTDDGFQGLLTGLSMAKLVDMDGDGTPELYCGAGLDGQHMYSYADGKIYAGYSGGREQLRHGRFAVRGFLCWRHESLSRGRP